MTTRESIFDRVTARDVLRLVGIAVPDDPRKLVRCPMHDDRTASMRVFDRGFTCFGCGAKGGLADLVMALGHAHDRVGVARWLEERVR